MQALSNIVYIHMIEHTMNQNRIVAKPSRLPCWAIALAWLTCSVAEAASPAMSAVRPTGGQRGTEVVVDLTGARLGDAQEVLFFQPGITVKKIEKVNDNHVKATFAIAADAQPGIYDIRLRTATGVSELRSFAVGLLPEVSEKEPNNDFAAGQAVTLGSVINGIAENEDIDYFVFDGKKGQRVTAEVEGIRLGITHFDPYVAILDSKRFELATSDDSALVWQDGFVSVILPEDGKYTLAVRESAYAGNGGCLYRVHLGDFPRAATILPSGGKIGEKVSVTWVGDLKGPITKEIQLPAANTETFGVFANDAAGQSAHPNIFRTSRWGNVIEAEPNENHEQATKFAAPLALNGVIEKPGDVDHYVFPAKKGETYDVSAYARRIRSPLDPVLYIAKKGGGAIVGNDDAVGPDSAFRFTAPEDGEYVIWILDHLGKGGKEYFYRIELTPVEARLALTLQSEELPRGTGNVAVSVPKGGRQAILVYATRENWGGDMKVAPENLPAGVTVESDIIPASQGVVPVLFKADKAAANGASMAKFTGAPVDPNVKLADQRFSHMTVMVHGLNLVNFWSRTVEQMAVAVTDEAPFEIEVVQPKVPLVHNGSMNLKVVAKRKEGFTAPIAVSFPWLPPGIGASGGISIPEGQNEALIPMNANTGTEVRTWKLVVNGTANTATGPMMVSTQLFDLRISPPYVNLTFQAASVDQGKAVPFAVKTAKAIDWAGEATVTLVGLPNKVTAEPLKLTKETPELVFDVKTDAVSPAGSHKNLFCQIVITENGEPVVHNLGSGEIRIDVPIPPKNPAAAAPMPMPTPMPVAQAPAAAPPKPLSRLEKLRLEAKERAAAAAKADAAPAPAAPAAEKTGGSK
jgi:hypothetical protein